MGCTNTAEQSRENINNLNLLITIHCNMALLSLELSN